MCILYYIHYTYCYKRTWLTPVRGIIHKIKRRAARYPKVTKYGKWVVVQVALFLINFGQNELVSNSMCLYQCIDIILFWCIQVYSIICVYVEYCIIYLLIYIHTHLHRIVAPLAMLLIGDSQRYRNSPYYSRLEWQIRLET